MAKKKKDKVKPITTQEKIDNMMKESFFYINNHRNTEFTKSQVYNIITQIWCETTNILKEE